MDNRAPMTLEQIEEFNALGLNPRSSTPQTSLAPMTPDQAPVYAGNQPPTGITGQPAVNPVIPPEPAVPPTPEPKPDEQTGKV